MGAARRLRTQRGKTGNPIKKRHYSSKDKVARRQQRERDIERKAPHQGIESATVPLPKKPKRRKKQF